MDDPIDKSRAAPEQEKRAPSASLLTLPQELRDLILAYLILKPQNTITMLPTFNHIPSPVSAQPPPICAVNHQIRSEALPTFYSLNTFTAQLDNSPDLCTAQTWLLAIGDANVAHLRRLALCGWTRIPFGHMVSRRWVTVVLDLKAGRMELESEEGRYQTDGGGGICGVGSTIEEMETTFTEAVKKKEGRAWEGWELAELMEGFNGLCTEY